MSHGAPPILTVPQSSPGAGYQARRAEIDSAIARVLESGWYILGREVEAFEQEFAAYVGTPYGVGVASGTDALQLALRACGVGPGDVVAAPSHTAVATVTAIDLCGATPLFIDIDPCSFTLDPNRLADTLEARARTSRLRPKAVIPVHLYGHPADMTAITEIAQRYEMVVVEDCAQAHGARWSGRRVGTWGDAAAFSFYPTKNLGALGDGGLVITESEAIADRVRLLREYGWRERYVSAVPGDNSRLDELQAAVLRAKLPHLDADNACRRLIARQYDTGLAQSGLTLPQTAPEANHVFHQYVVRADARDALRAYLRERGIGTLVHYPVPVHQQPAYARFAGDTDLTHTEAAARTVLSLPLFPELNKEQIEAVTAAIGTWVGA